MGERKRLTMKHYRQVELLKKTYQEKLRKSPMKRWCLGSWVGRGGGERKRLTMKHYRQVELLNKTHQEQLEQFSKDNEKVGVWGVELVGVGVRERD